MSPATLLSLGLVFLVAAHLPFASQDDTWPRRVLITNDDGIDDSGLLALAEAFAPVAETYVVAPLDNRSGSTSYISAIGQRSLDVVERDLGDGITAYGVDGYPADAVAWALKALLAENPPDLVISGINNGPNLSDDAYLSGTVGAARIAAFFGVPAIAVSGHNGEPETLSAIASWVIQLSRTQLVRGLATRQYLTVSIPRVTAAEIQGVDVARRGPRTWEMEFERNDSTGDPPGHERWSFLIVGQQPATPVGTDTHAYGENRIAIVPMRVDEHDYELLEKLLNSDTGIPGWPPPGDSR